MIYSDDNENWTLLGLMFDATFYVFLSYVFIYVKCGGAFYHHFASIFFKSEDRNYPHNLNNNNNNIWVSNAISAAKKEGSPS